MWTGALSMQPSAGWVLSIPFYGGLVFFIPKFRVLLLLMDISPLSSRGVRQRSPLLSLLYILAAEVLAVNNRCNLRIPGFCLPRVPLVVSPVHQFADDTTFILSTDDSIKAVFDIYSKFEKALGSWLNQSKSKGL